MIYIPDVTRVEGVGVAIFWGAQYIMRNTCRFQPISGAGYRKTILRMECMVRYLPIL